MLGYKLFAKRQDKIDVTGFVTTRFMLRMYDVVQYTFYLRFLVHNEMMNRTKREACEFYVIHYCLG